MASRKSTTVRPVTIDLDQFPGAAVYRTAPDEFWPMYLGRIVGEVASASQSAAECPAIAAWVKAHPECQVTTDSEADLLALEARAQLLDEQADADAEQERANAVASQHVAALNAWRAADEGLARHLLGELAENRFQATLALMNGERYTGESDSLDAAYDRKRQQLAELGYDVTAAAGGPLELVNPDAAPYAYEDALAARCSCFRGALLNGDNERDACVIAGHCLDEADAEDKARALAEDEAYGAYVEAHGHDPAKWVSSWRVTQEQMRAIAADLGLLVPAEPLHPDPAMDVATFAAVWDARSESLGRVARALRGEA